MYNEKYRSYNKGSIVLTKEYENVGLDGYATSSISVEQDVQSATTNGTLFERPQQNHHGVVAPTNGVFYEQPFTPSPLTSLRVNVVSSEGCLEPIQHVEEGL